jgi:hypothetical protein
MQLVSVRPISQEEVDTLSSLDFDRMNNGQRQEVLSALQDIASILSMPPARRGRTSIRDGFRAARTKIFAGKSEAD